MAIRTVTNGLVTLESADTVIGVVLEREIQNGVKVRPTNVTAAISTTAITVADQSAPTAAEQLLIDALDPDVILLHNGNNGGFSQNFKPSTFTAGDSFVVNTVIKEIITDQ